MVEKTKVFSEEQRKLIRKLASLKYGKPLIKGLVKYYVLDEPARRAFYVGSLDKRFLRFEEANTEKARPILRDVIDLIRCQAEGCSEPENLRSEVEEIIGGGQKGGK